MRKPQQKYFASYQGEGVFELMSRSEWKQRIDEMIAAGETHEKIHQIRFMQEFDGIQAAKRYLRNRMQSDIQECRSSLRTLSTIKQS